ncbi:hypothetical protein JCM19233_1789 [Vibrio astriarenae]|nr:hypothetical protein JCM19233_1789 [Vibrio sp. C7]
MRYTYTGKPIAGTNHVVDSSHFALTNPHVPDETVMLHYDAVSVWSESQQRWFTDEEIFGTRYLSSFGNLGAGYIFQLNGHWHFSRDTSGSSGRGILITTLHMRNPDSSQ